MAAFRKFKNTEKKKKSNKTLTTKCQLLSDLIDTLPRLAL